MAFSFGGLDVSGPGFYFGGGAAAFSPLDLDPVAFYDPSDTSTLFQDAAGTTPVTTAGDPVGLFLDGSQGASYAGGTFGGLGSELIANGEFNSAAGWLVVGSGSVSGGSGHLDSSSGTAMFYQEGVLSQGETFVAILDVSTVSGEVELINSAGFEYASFAAAGQYSVVFQHSGADESVFLRCRNGSIASITSLSVRKLPGHHLSQTVNDDYRPERTEHGLLFDGVDDYLEASFPAGTLPASASVFAMVRTTDSNFIPISGLRKSGSTGFLGVAESGSASTVLSNEDASVFVDGVEVMTRDAFYIAVADGSWRLTEFRGCVLSNWTSIGLSTFAGRPLAGEVGPVLVVDTAQADQHRTQIENWMRKQVGL